MNIVTRTVRRLILRAFEAAGGGPRSVASAWATEMSPVRSALAARPRLASRAQYSVQNSPSAAAIADVWCTHLVGDGPSVRSAHPDRSVRRALETAWGRFYVRADLLSLLMSTARSLVISGEAIVHLAVGPRGELKPRLLSPEQLDSSITRDIEGGRRIIAGVEFDAFGEPVAYHVLPAAPEVGFPTTWQAVRIPAADVLHIFEARSPGAVRGVSWLAPVLTRLSELDTLEDALTVRARVAAMFGGFISDPEGTSGLGTGKVDPQELSLEPGVMRVLPPAASVTFPDVPDSGDAQTLIRHLLRSIAAGCGLPYELLSGDLSQVNYSSAKLGQEAFKRRCAALRASLVDARMLRPLWERMVMLEALSGRLRVTTTEPCMDVAFLWPQWAALDPLKEAQADVLLLQSGLRSRADIIASRGRDIEDVDAELAADGYTPKATPKLTVIGEDHAA